MNAVRLLETPFLPNYQHQHLKRRPSQPSSQTGGLWTGWRKRVLLTILFLSALALGGRLGIIRLKMPVPSPESPSPIQAEYRWSGYHRVAPVPLEWVPRPIN